MKKRNLRIGVASDHAAFDLKRDIVAYLKEGGYEVLDRGARSGRRSVDYPDFAFRVVNDILDGNADLGVLLCGTGIGMSMTANRFKGIRAAVVHDLSTAIAAAGHNRANILCIGARLVAPALACTLVQAWLDTPFEARHQHRLDLIDELAG